MRKVRKTLHLESCPATVQVLAGAKMSKNRIWPDHRTGEWTEEKNDRRCDLIDKQIAGTASVAERLELDDLQRQAMAFRDRIAPLPMAGALRLHAELVAKKNSHQTKG